MENTVQVNNVTKTFTETVAVDQLSFQVKPGEIFAMLGPNGAGKTTTIRMILDILRPDSGTIQVLGGSPDRIAMDRVGYLPEERGLYRDLPVKECLAYLGELKGLSRGVALSRSIDWLERVGLEDAMDKKVSALSRGMQQKAQFIATVLHDPDLLIVDEPFAGLDPVNTMLIKDMIYDLKDKGRTVIMSTHMMHQIEEMADRLLMVNEGRLVLYGKVSDIQSQFASHSVYVSGDGDWMSLEGVEEVAFDRDEKAYKLLLSEDYSADTFLRDATRHSDFRIDRFQVALPALDEIFVQVAGGNHQ